METYTVLEKRLIAKVRKLTPAQISEIEHFIDSLSQQDTDRTLTHNATSLAEPAFARVWDNPDDADYDDL